MGTRLARSLGSSEPVNVAVAVLGAGLLAYLGVHRMGTSGLLLPVAIVLLIALMRKPVVMVALTAGLAIICEGPTFGLFSFTNKLYEHIYKELTPLDVLVALTVVSVGIDVIRSRREVRVPRPLVVPFVLLVLAMLAGAVTGRAAGESIRTLVFAEAILLYLLLLPLVVANLDIDRRQTMLLLGGALALAVVKAVLGLAEVLGHYGQPIEGTSTLTYYEPAANWLVMCALLAMLGLLLARIRPPRWALLGTPLLFACLLLSYRRSFWVAAVLGILLVMLLGSSSTARRTLLPVGLLAAAAIWTLGATNFQNSGSPIVRRAASLVPSKLETNVEDRYRLDERANVLGAIGQHPITGIGLSVPWSADFRPLSIEHPGGREYVHFAALWWWLKLGILGLAAYIAMLCGVATLAWQVWRRSPEPTARAFGLASLCAFVGLVAIETTASFTGVDQRFTVIFGVQVGLLALLARLPLSPARGS